MSVAFAFAMLGASGPYRTLPYLCIAEQCDASLRLAFAGRCQAQRSAAFAIHSPALRCLTLPHNTVPLPCITKRIRAEPCPALPCQAVLCPRLSVHLLVAPWYAFAMHDNAMRCLCFARPFGAPPLPLSCAVKLFYLISSQENLPFPEFLHWPRPFSCP